MSRHATLTNNTLNTTTARRLNAKYFNISRLKSGILPEAVVGFPPEAVGFPADAVVFRGRRHDEWSGFLCYQRLVDLPPGG